MSLARRLQVMYDSKQQEWEVVYERLTSLRQARLIETDPGNQFKLDRQLKTSEQELATIQQELTQLEQQLAQVGHNTASPSSQDYPPQKKSQASYPKTAPLPGVVLILAGFLLFFSINALTPGAITVFAVIGGGIPLLIGITLLIKAL